MAGSRASALYVLFTTSVLVLQCVIVVRWDPDREDEIFYAQSASLYTYYYQVQISVHRAFVASHRGHTLALASLIVCTNAARSCVRMLEQVTQRLGDPIPRHAVRLSRLMQDQILREADRE